MILVSRSSSLLWALGLLLVIVVLDWSDGLQLASQTWEGLPRVRQTYLRLSKVLGSTSATSSMSMADLSGMKSSLLSLSYVMRVYLFLDLERDSLYWALLDSLHQVGSVAGDLVPESLGGHFGVVGQNLLVDVEIVGQFQVVLLNQLSGGSLNSLGSDSALQF